ncbi:LexA regulated protein [Proteus vulgaris]|nr:LexA regulated protein [Proteus vulgaris]
MAGRHYVGYYWAFRNLVIGIRPFTAKFMAKEQTDRTTLDLFADERRPGRPKTNPLSRDEQLRINKRNQLRRDRVNGLRRVELKLNEDAVNALNELATARNVSRSELIEEILLEQLAQNYALKMHQNENS